MANPYFDTPNYTPLARLTTARAEALDTIITAIASGFSLLPVPADLYNDTAIYVGLDTGGANAYVVTTKYTDTSYVDGMAIVLKPSNTNTGPSTLNVNEIGAIAIVNFAGNALAGGELLANIFVTVRYDAINNFFRITNPNITVQNASSSVSVPYGVATGTDAYLVTPSPGLTGLFAGMQISVLFTNANTGAACTLNAGGTGVKSVVHVDGSPPTATDIPAGSIWNLIYDLPGGGRWQLLGPVVNVTGLLLINELFAGN